MKYLIYIGLLLSLCSKQALSQVKEPRYPIIVDNGYSNISGSGNNGWDKKHRQNLLDSIYVYLPKDKSKEQKEELAVYVLGKICNEITILKYTDFLIVERRQYIKRKIAESEKLIRLQK